MMISKATFEKLKAQGVLSKNADPEKILRPPERPRKHEPPYGFSRDAADPDFLLYTHKPKDPKKRG